MTRYIALSRCLLIGTLLPLLSPFFLIAQPRITFEHGLEITSFIEQGKFDFYFNDVWRAPDGQLWISNMQHLYRYDGFEFERFEVGSDLGINNYARRMSTIRQTQQGTVWIGTEGSGVLQLDPVSRSSQRIRLKSDATMEPIVYESATDQWNGTWFGSENGLLYIPQADSLSLHNIQGPSPSLALSQLLSSRKSLAEVLQVPSRQYRTETFDLDQATSLLVVAMGSRKKRYGIPTQTWADKGWITNSEGDTLWIMDSNKSLQDRGPAEVSQGILELGPGTYTLHFQTDASIAFGDWTPEGLFAEILPGVPDWWGIQVFPVNAALRSSVDSLWQDFPSSSGLQQHAPHLYQEADGTIWVYGTGLQKLQVDEQGTPGFDTYFTSQVGQKTSPFAKIGAVHTHDSTRLWVSGQDHRGKVLLGLLDKKTRHFTPIKTGLNAPGKILRKGAANPYLLDVMLQDHEGNLWLAGKQSNGLFRLSPPFISEEKSENPTPIRFQGPIYRGQRVSYHRLKDIQALALDENQNLWITTRGDFIHKISLTPLPFQVLPVNTWGPEKYVRGQSVIKGPQGNLWISQWLRTKELNTRLVRYDPRTGKSDIMSDSLPPSDNPYHLLAGFPNEEEMLIYAGYNYYTYNLKTKEQKIYEIGATKGRIDHEVGNYVFNDSLMLVGLDSIGLFNFRTGKIQADFSKHLRGIPRLAIWYRSRQVNDSTFWLATLRGQTGLFTWTKEGLREEKKIPHFNSEGYRGITTMEDGRLILADRLLYEGVNDQDFARVHSSNELAEFLKTSVTHLLPRGNHQLWLFTPQRNGVYDLQRKILRPLPQFKGVRVNLHGLFAHQDGSVSMASRDDTKVFYFHPDSVKPNLKPPTLLLVQLNARGEDSTQREDLSWFALQPAYAFPHDRNSIRITFKGLQFSYPEGVQYQYRLEGSSNESWQQAGSSREVQFFDLAPGSYTFSLKAGNENDVWSEPVHLDFTIRQPWWWTTLAKGFYLLLLAISAYVLYQFLLSRQLAESEASRLAEMDEVKTRLYTNITHEFRTPLTIIQGMADKIEAQPERWLQKGVQMIYRNSQQLLGLINQMLDLSKLDSGKLNLRLVQSDVIPLLMEIGEAYQVVGESKGIPTFFHTSIQELSMDHDPDRLREVLNNLLSNALKFTPRGGEVHFDIQANEKNLILVIRDTGPGIPPKELPHIFDRFYQVDSSSTRQGEGTGIGLALTKNLVELMGGSIVAASQAGQGTEFTIMLPIRKEAVLAASEFSSSTVLARMSQAPHIHEPLVQPAKRPTLLVIEDNEDVRTYLASCLEADYLLDFAFNGQEGIDKALETVPDLILSDVMMPKKDGFEVVYALKQDLRTSHIPIVLLTARADQDSKLTGFRQGADAYLTKPFHEEELLLRLRNMLDWQSKVQERYQHPGKDAGKEGLYPATDWDQEDKFIQQFREVVFTQMENAQLDVSLLQAELGMTRTPLHNKIKALTGMSTTEFVRYIRLHHALVLLRDPSLNISQVSYKCGFQSHTYFTKKFGELFGYSPTKYRQEKSVSPQEKG